ncbi:hypothetical protein SGLAM104S_09708 [Streptomyces glaucescens]
MSALALSVLLSLVSAVAYAGGAIVQERVAESSPGEQYAPLRRPGWWAAVALNGLGGLLHVVALAYGPLSVVQPLGALTIVFALPMAALFVGRRAGATAWRGAVMATVGLAGLLSLVGRSAAIAESVSPRTTVYISARPARNWGVVCGRTSATEVRAVRGETPPSGRMPGLSPPRVSPASCEHAGQAPGPCPSSTFSATAICWSLVARSARGAYAVPP